MLRGRRWLALGGLGLGISILVGSGLVAVLSDSLLSEVNQAQSGTVAGHDLQAAFIPIDTQVGLPDDCDNNLAVSDGPLAAAVSDGGSGPFSIDLNQTGEQVFDPTGTSAICVVNKGTKPGQVVMNFATVVDAEVGPCEGTEADPSLGNDSSCNDGDSGELAAVIMSSVIPSAAGIVFSPSDPSCTPTGPVTVSFSEMVGTPQVIDTDLQPGEGCAFFIGLEIRGDVTEQELFKAQTDLLTWDIVFTLEDLP